MAHIKHREIKAAYCFYYAMHDLSDPVKTNARWQQLMEDTLILSKQVPSFGFSFSSHKEVNQRLIRHDTAKL